jgi:hypothetical protein
MHLKVFLFSFSSFVSSPYLHFLFLIIVDIISLFSIALATAHSRVAALEAELKASTEALKDANAAKVLLRRLVRQQKPGLKRLKKLWLRLIRDNPSGNRL